MFEKISAIIAAIRNMFPLEAGTVRDFVAEVRLNKKPVEIRPICMVNTNQLDSGTRLTWRKFIVKLVSKTNEGRIIVHERCLGILFDPSDPTEEKKLFRKIHNHANTILVKIRREVPCNISTKIVEV